MDKNSLSHLLKKIEWKLVAKAAAIALALLWAWGSDFSLVPVIVFGIVPTVVYFSESPERRHFRNSYWLMTLLSLIGIGMVNGANGVTPASLAIACVFAIGILVEVGLFRFFFAERSLAYSVVNIALVIASSFIFFAGTLTLISLLFLLFSYYILFREFFALIETPWRGRALLMSAALAFFGVEIALFVRFLPLGFVNAGAFMGLLLLLLRDAARSHFEGSISLSFILRSLIILLAGSVLIFGLSVWNI